MSEYKITEEKEWDGLFKRIKMYRLQYKGWAIFSSNDKEKIEKYKEKHKVWLKEPHYKVFEMESGEYSPMYKNRLDYDMKLVYSHLNTPEYYEKLEDACDVMFELEKLRLRRFIKKEVECVQ